MEKFGIYKSNEASTARCLVNAELKQAAALIPGQKDILLRNVISRRDDAFFYLSGVTQADGEEVSAEIIIHAHDNDVVEPSLYKVIVNGASVYEVPKQ